MAARAAKGHYFWSLDLFGGIVHFLLCALGFRCARIMGFRDRPIQSGRPLTIRVRPSLIRSKPKFRTSPTGIMTKTKWGAQRPGVNRIGLLHGFWISLGMARAEPQRTQRKTIQNRRLNPRPCSTENVKEPTLGLNQPPCRCDPLGSQSKGQVSRPYATFCAMAEWHRRQRE